MLVTRYEQRRAFTLIELLVVISIMGLLTSILMPAFVRARGSAKSVVCLSRLRTLGQGLALYVNAHRDVLPPGRLPPAGDDHWRSRILGGIKYRPTFLALMANEVGLQPFDDPQSSRLAVDRFGQPGDRQNYSSEQYVCPETPEWLDERNGSYGYNYQFLGNARLSNVGATASYKNWPVLSSRVRTPARCIAIGDSMGTAASFAQHDRSAYEDSAFGDRDVGRTASAYGNEGFNLDPPRVDPIRGEMAGLHESPPLRTALHPRHNERCNALWVDAHGTSQSLIDFGYQASPEGVILLNGDNRFFSITGKDDVWAAGSLGPK